MMKMDDLFLMADKVVTDLSMDVIGWDSCVLATRVLHERLKSKGVKSTPLGCWVKALYKDQEVRLCDEDGAAGHAVLLVDDLMLDLTVNQIHWMNPKFPRLEAVAMRIPRRALQEEGFVGTINMGDVRLTYSIDMGPAYYLDSVDWRRPIKHIERSLKAVKLVESLFKAPASMLLI